MSQQNPRPYNRPINHIALSCSDLSALVPWYVEVLGFELLGEVRHFKRSEDPAPFETIFVSYPKSLQELKFAILTTGNGVGIECFQFIDPPHKPQEQAFDFSRAGFFHVCVTDPNPEALVQSICDRGGKKIGDWMDYSVLGLSGHKGVYTQDPWGNTIEVMSLTMERVASAGEALAHVINMREKL